MTDKNGDIWSIPTRQWGFGCLQTVRKDWREELGMGPITTLDELENYLKAVKTADFDGNGVDDTIPMTSFGNPTKTLKGYDDFFRTLGYCVIEDVCTEMNFLDSDGKIKPVYMHPKYKDFVALLNKWHKEGLLHPELYSVQSSQINDLIMANKVGSTSGWYSNHIRPADTLKNDLAPDAEYEFIKPNTITGKTYSWWRESVGNPWLGIVSYSDNAEWAIKLLDWMVSSEDNYWTTKRGIKDYHWKWIDQSQGTFEILKSPDDMTKTYNYAEGFMSVYGKGAVHWEDRAANPDNVIAGYYKARDFMFALPGYSIPDWFVQYDWTGTSIELSMEEGETLMGENIIKMIIGEKPLSDWDALIQEYRKIHADKYIELANIQYQEYLPKK